MIPLLASEPVDNCHVRGFREADPRRSSFVSVGIEERVQPEKYSWDGQKRGVSKHQKIWLYQYTISGSGSFASGGEVFSMTPGHAFAAVLPSAHKYWLPAASTHWKYAWLSTNHSFVRERFAQLFPEDSTAFPIEQTSPVLFHLERIISSVASNHSPDLLSLESDLLQWAIALDRHITNLKHPSELRDRIMNSCRSFIGSNLARFIDVDELANIHGMNRSHFSHFFKSATGLSASRYILDVRLDEVLNLLRQPQRTLKEIAGFTGFADANHLCKCFKRKFHQTPGSYRRQILV